MGPLFALVAALTFIGAGSTDSSAIGISNQPQASSPASPAESDIDRLIDGFDQALSKHNYSGALVIASSLHPDNPTGHAIVDGLRAAALIGLKRDAEARHLIAEASRLAPESIEPTKIVFFSALEAGSMEFATDALDQMIARAPDAVREIETYNMELFLEKEPAGDLKRNQDRRIALARIGYGSNTPTGQRIAGEGVDLLVRRGDFAGAEALLPFVLDPETIENMLITRRYAPLWPRLAELGGPKLQLVRKAYVDAAQRAYDEAPDDHAGLLNLVDAFRGAEEFKRAIALRSKLPQDEASLSVVDERMGWAINGVAMALHEAGQAQEADRLFASFNDLSLPKEDWRVGMKINRLELLVADGKFDRTLPLIELTAKTKGTAYEDQVTRGLRYCTLRRLGRSKAAARYLPELMAHAEDATAATMDYLLCAGEPDKAEALALAQLKNPDEDKRLDFETEFVSRLQIWPSDDRPVWQDSWRQLRQRPAIATEFSRLGRDMPENLLPKPDTLQ